MPPVPIETRLSKTASLSDEGEAPVPVLQGNASQTRTHRVTFIGERAQKKLPPKSVEQVILSKVQSSGGDAERLVSQMMILGFWRVCILVFSMFLTGVEIHEEMTSIADTSDLYSLVVFVLQGVCILFFLADALYALKCSETWNHYFSSLFYVVDVFYLSYLVRTYLHALVLHKSPHTYASIVSVLLRAIRVLAPLLFRSPASASESEGQEASRVPRELRRLFRGFGGSMRTIFWLFFVVVVLVYFWAILLSAAVGQQAGPEWLERPRYLGSLGRSMFSCFQMVTLDHWAVSISRQLHDVSPVMNAVSVLFLYCVAFAGVRILVGVVVEQVTSSAREQLKDRSEFVSRLEESLIVSLEDEITAICGGNAEISHEQLRQLMLRKNIHSKLAALEISTTAVDELFRVLNCENQNKVNISKLTNLLTQTRGEASNTRMVLIQLRLAAGAQRAKAAALRISHLASTVGLTLEAMENWNQLFESNRIRHRAKHLAVVFNKKRAASREAIMRRTDASRVGTPSANGRPNSTM